MARTAALPARGGAAALDPWVAFVKEELINNPAKQAANLRLLRAFAVSQRVCGEGRPAARDVPGALVTRGGQSGSMC